MKVRKFLLILVIIIISLLGCENNLDSNNTNADEHTGAYEVADDTLTYSKVADLYNGSELYYGNYSIKIENDSISEMNDEWFNYSTLQVNNIILTFLGEEIESTFNIVDIDSSDKYKEIAVSEQGLNKRASEVFNGLSNAG